MSTISMLCQGSASQFFLLFASSNPWLSFGDTLHFSHIVLKLPVVIIRWSPEKMLEDAGPDAYLLKSLNFLQKLKKRPSFVGDSLKALRLNTLYHKFLLYDQHPSILKWVVIWHLQVSFFAVFILLLSRNIKCTRMKKQE